MSKTKYDPSTMPQLAKQYARDGMRDVEIAKALGIVESTLYEYKNKYPEFAEAIKASKEVVDSEVVDVLLKRILGYDYKESEVILTKQDDNTKPVRIKETKRHMPADVTAIIFWLKNRQPAKWRDKPEGKSEDDSNKGSFMEALTTTAKEAWKGEQVPTDEPDEEADSE